jgi:Monogalactosyldiacylglycerol (MGDG) synthase
MGPAMRPALVLALLAGTACICSAFTVHTALRPSFTHTSQHLSSSSSGSAFLTPCSSRLLPCSSSGFAAARQPQQAYATARRSLTMQQQPEQQQPPPDDKQPRGFLGVRSLGRKLKAAASKVSTFNGNAANYTSNALGLSFGVRKADKTRLHKRRGSSVSTVGLKQASPGEHVYTAENLRRKVLILMSDTGGGHRASAQALQAAFDMEYPGCIEVDIVDIWTEHGPWPFNQFVSSYAYMARNPPVWRLFWEYGRFPLTRYIRIHIHTC